MVSPHQEINLQKSPPGILLSVTVKESSGSHIDQEGCFLENRPLELLLDAGKQTFPAHMRLHALRGKQDVLNVPHVARYHFHILSDFQGDPDTEHS